jgi:hypothetical protein
VSIPLIGARAAIVAAYQVPLKGLNVGTKPCNSVDLESARSRVFADDKAFLVQLSGSTERIHVCMETCTDSVTGSGMSSECPTLQAAGFLCACACFHNKFMHTLHGNPSHIIHGLVDRHRSLRDAHYADCWVYSLWLSNRWCTERTPGANLDHWLDLHWGMYHHTARFVMGVNKWMHYIHGNIKPTQRSASEQSYIEAQNRRKLGDKTHDRRVREARDAKYQSDGWVDINHTNQGKHTSNGNPAKIGRNCLCLVKKLCSIATQYTGIPCRVATDIVASYLLLVGIDDTYLEHHEETVSYFIDQVIPTAKDGVIKRIPEAAARDLWAFALATDIKVPKPTLPIPLLEQDPPMESTTTQVMSAPMESITTTHVMNAPTPPLNISVLDNMRDPEELERLVLGHFVKVAHQVGELEQRYCTSAPPTPITYVPPLSDIPVVPLYGRIVQYGTQLIKGHPANHASLTDYINMDGSVIPSPAEYPIVYHETIVDDPQERVDIVEDDNRPLTGRNGDILKRVTTIQHVTRYEVKTDITLLVPTHIRLMLYVALSAMGMTALFLANLSVFIGCTSLFGVWTVIDLFLRREKQTRRLIANRNVSGLWLEALCVECSGKRFTASSPESTMARMQCLNFPNSRISLITRDTLAEHAYMMSLPLEVQDSFQAVAASSLCPLHNVVVVDITPAAFEWRNTQSCGPLPMRVWKQQLKLKQVKASTFVNVPSTMSACPGTSLTSSPLSVWIGMISKLRSQVCANVLLQSCLLLMRVCYLSFMLLWLSGYMPIWFHWAMKTFSILKLGCSLLLIMDTVKSNYAFFIMSLQALRRG